MSEYRPELNALNMSYVQSLFLCISKVWHEHIIPLCVILPLVGITCRDSKGIGQV
jgi:hypothetical protein